jgi:acyl carrier protein
MNLEYRNKIQPVVTSILSKVLGIDDVYDEALLSRANPIWDSLKQLQIALELEDYFGVEIRDEDLMEFHNIDSILILLHKYQLGS